VIAHCSEHDSSHTSIGFGVNVDSSTQNVQNNLLESITRCELQCIRALLPDSALDNIPQKIAGHVKLDLAWEFGDSCCHEMMAIKDNCSSRVLK